MSSASASQSLPQNHVLALLRPSPTLQSVGYAFDTTTLAAHDFDVDARTGFMPPEPPVARLPADWAAWEETLDHAISSRLRLGDSADGIGTGDLEKSAQWHALLRQMPLLPLGQLINSERLLRRAHLVLSWLLHIYVHTQPLEPTPIVIPRSLGVPLLAVSRELVLPPVLTYADTVLYNWREVDGHLRCVTLFTETPDEEHFFLTSARIELAGVAALSLMQQSLDEAFVDDAIAHRRIASYLGRLAIVIRSLTTILDAVRERCDPGVFYNDVRPWFRGEDSGKREWIFQDERGNEVDLGEKRELSGPSAGQSTLIHALDIFLGVDHSMTPGPSANAHPSTGHHQRHKTTPFLERMLAYMPRHHRNFINHLKTVPRPIRNIAIQEGTDSPSGIAYNEAVTALKEFRNAHIRIATLYIINQSHRTHDLSTKPEPAKGTGGTDLVPFLKSSRDDTANTLLANQHSL